jgi:hypothetical protein
MSSNPAAAKTSASDVFARDSPRAPAASCRRPTSRSLWVLACGRRATPAARARSAMRAMLRSSTSTSMRTAGWRRRSRWAWPEYIPTRARGQPAPEARGHAVRRSAATLAKDGVDHRGADVRAHLRRVRAVQPPRSRGGGGGHRASDVAVRGGHRRFGRRRVDGEAGLGRSSPHARRRQHVFFGADGKALVLPGRAPKGRAHRRGRARAARSGDRRSRTTASTGTAASIQSASAARCRATSAGSDCGGRQHDLPAARAHGVPVQPADPGRQAQGRVLALLIEQQLTKDQILELYLNRVALSAGTFGVEAMSRQLFGKRAKDLGLLEAAIVAGLIRAPSALSPWSNEEGALSRSKVVLARMRQEGFISAAAEQGANAARVRMTSAPHLADAHSGYAKEYLRQAFRDEVGDDDPPDWDVQTTFLPPVQLAAERAVEEGLARLASAACRRPWSPRPGDGGHPGHGGRPQLQRVALQPRGAQPPAAGLRIQAVRLRGRPRPRPLARHRPRQPALRDRRPASRSGVPATRKRARPTRPPCARPCWSRTTRPRSPCSSASAAGPCSPWPPTSACATSPTSRPSPWARGW